jgi:hypothetical protein
MSESMLLEEVAKPAQAVALLETRVEDLEDLRDLEDAIRENEGKPLIPWGKAKADLDLE